MNLMEAPACGGPELTHAKKTVRIAIADDHPIVRDGLKRLLQLESDFKVVGEAGDGRQALDLVERTDPDVLLLDLGMPNPDGLATLQALQHANRRTRVIVLTASKIRMNSCSR